MLLAWQGSAYPWTSQPLAAGAGSSRHRPVLSGDPPQGAAGLRYVVPLLRFCCPAGCRLAQAGQGSFHKKQPDEVITVWWQYIAIPALLAAGIYGFVVLVRHMTQQVTRETDRRAEDMYAEFDSARKEKDRWPI